MFPLTCDTQVHRLDNLHDFAPSTADVFDLSFIHPYSLG